MKLTKNQRTLAIATVAGLAALEISIRTAKGQGTKSPWLNAVIAGVAMGCIVCQTADTIDMINLLDEMKKN